MDLMIFGRRVLERRKELKLSQESLAQHADVSRNYISLIERGLATNVSTVILTNLADALGLPPGELWGKVEEEDRGIIPSALRQYGIQAGLRYEVVDWLARLPRRGRQPKTVDEWHNLYEAVRPYVEEDAVVAG